MDILGVASEINSELGKIRYSYPYALGAEERSDLFETIETCLINNLVTIIELSINDFASQKELIKWSYNLTDKDYIHREGEKLENILNVIDSHQNYVYLKSSFQFSPKYYELYFIDREELLEGTMLDEKYKHPENPYRKKDNDYQKEYVDWNVIKYELTELFVKINPQTDAQKWANTIYKQLEKFMKRSYISGVQFAILNESRYRLQKWRFDLNKNKNRKLNRYGDNIDNIIINAQRYHGSLLIAIEPQFTEAFKNIAKDQQEQELKGTLFEKRATIIELITR